MPAEQQRFNLTSNPHRRYNPLSKEWVQVSPHRTQRPWQGQTEQPPQEHRPRYDPACYLCPGNERAGGVKNPDYKHTFVFTNDFSALLPDTPSGTYDEGGLLVAEHARDMQGGLAGTCLKRLEQDQGLSGAGLCLFIAFERFLARLFAGDDPPWMLKGGDPLEMRLGTLRAPFPTRDVDLARPLPAVVFTVSP